MIAAITKKCDGVVQWVITVENHFDGLDTKAAEAEVNTEGQGAVEIVIKILGYVVKGRERQWFLY